MGRSSELRVTAFAPTDRADWDAFVADHPDATFCHASGWYDAVGEGLRHRPHFLMARRRGEVEAVLPLAEVKSRLFGHTLVSTPGCVYGGVLASNAEARQAVIEHACKLAQELGVGALELRNQDPVETGWPTKDQLYVTFRKAITDDDEANLKAIPRKQRAMVRKGIKAGLVTEQTRDLDRFYAIYAESVRNLGTPVFPRRYFEVLHRVFGDVCELSIVTHAGTDIAGVMSFFHRDTVLPYYGGSRPPARSLYGNDFMYWDLMSRAAQRGMREFDYGRSKRGTGSFSFKKNWGFAPQPLHYQYYLVKRHAVPDVNPSNPKYKYFIAAWKRLPLPVANRIGPVLARHLG
ncbi:MAG: FemAB family PEP-CTERM system-associated protein [Thiohalocapsa sp.]|jgi:FemAB-related protein (PEP-CTERM system-associated)|uniref:FemAB family XrtA/PEP-CTERM system-associated protein n=1 Tax=Thiohalocapsa sp. TaxID=2497641 RepID=UPI0025FA1539|nr:FemAB family XrtA/PEP-CTERM system-associated protein [Thiohalocapsa sp.]MCG6940118.1 FemAB family PEP-CTERM system-associated protein [Thiohalocapsa sp.]